MGIVASLLLLSSILVHELAHSFVSSANHIPVRSITLFVFGGVAQIGRKPDQPISDFHFASAGLIASAVLAVGFWLLSHVAGDRIEHLVAEDARFRPTVPMPS